jgi:hypothetical protein
MARTQGPDEAAESSCKQGPFASPRRLEELSEARQGMVARVKASEREREGLEGAKAAAEAYLARDRECTATHAAIYQLFMRDGQVQPWPAAATSPGSIQPALPCSQAPKLRMSARSQHVLPAALQPADECPLLVSLRYGRVCDSVICSLP